MGSYLGVTGAGRIPICEMTAATLPQRKMQFEKLFSANNSKMDCLQTGT
jgi:hypothetical protein